MRFLSCLAFVVAVFGMPAQAADCPSPQKPMLTAEYRTGCDLIFPKDDGFAGRRADVRLEPGKLIDRFVSEDRAGHDDGQYFSPEGEAYSRRALPYVCKAMVYTVYQVRQPITLLGGEIAPWFGSPGGGTQYYSKERLQSLLKRGAIVPVQWFQDAPCDE